MKFSGKNNKKYLCTGCPKKVCDPDFKEQKYIIFFSTYTANFVLHR
jgi:hypothetical protein